MTFLRQLAGRMSTRSEGESSSESDEEREYDIRQARCEVNRRKIGLAMDKRLVGRVGPEAEGRQESLVEWVRSAVLMRECVRYVPDPAAKGPDLGTSPRCHCGAQLEEHWHRAGKAEASSPSHDSLKAGGSGAEGLSQTSPRNFILTPRMTEELIQQRKSRESVRKGGASVFPLSRVPGSELHSVETVRGALPPKLPPLGSDRRGSVHGSTSSRAPAPPPLRFDDRAKNVPDTGTSIGSPSGSPKSQHKEKVWEPEAAFCDLPTNAFGKVEFANDEARSKPAKFIRLSYETEMETVEKLFAKFRMMEPHRPSLAISVIGGAKNFSLDGKKKEIFNRGLVKAAQATNAWILTYGFHFGVTKAVGEAVRDGQSLHMAGHFRVTHSLRCIGIAPWGYTQGRSELVSGDGLGSWPATYHVDPVIRPGKPVSLDPNHTHFLLVDDGYRNSFRPQVANFRARLERHIAAPLVLDGGTGTGSGAGGMGIPVVVVLVEGGLDSIDFAYESLKRRVPLVVCQGTGRAADLLAYAHTHHVAEVDEEGRPSGHRLLPDAQRALLLDKLRAAYGKSVKKSSRLGADFQGRLDLISKCCQEEDLITVFDINRDADLDLAILSALLKGRGASRLDQLRLSLKWNRADVAEEKIFTDSAVWEWGQLDEVMLEALAHGRTEFVRLLLQHGVVMRDFLTVRRLRLLYNFAGRTSFLRRMLQALSGGQNRFLLHHVKTLLERLLERKVEEVYSLDVDDDGAADTTDLLATQPIDDFFSPISEARFQKPFKELFLWAVLMNRPKMARFFWERGDSPVIGGLVATKVYDSLAKLVGDESSDLAQALRAQKDEFEGLSMSVLSGAFNVDPEKALLIVEEPQSSWGRVSSLEMAAAASDKRFLATPASQTSIDQLWKRGLACSGLDVVLGLLCPLFVLLRIQFDASSLGVERSELSWWQKLRIFWSAPITKFASFTLAYLCFLALYTYFVLFDLHKIWQPTEITVHVWVGSLMVSLVRDAVSDYVRIPREHRQRSRLFQHLRDANFWVKMEVVGLASHCGGLLLRCLPPKAHVPDDLVRCVFCLAIVFFYLRLFRAYMASSYLGPKLFVIKQMFSDVVMFMLILIVFMMAYAIGTQALLFPKREFYWGILTDILYHPYWQMYGELNLDETIGGNLDGCVGNMTQNARGQFCPRKFWPAALLLGVYLLIVNILLVNLLIAVFTHVFDEVQAKSTEIWKFELWKLATEFDRKAVLPPPLALFENLASGVRFAVRCGRAAAGPVVPLTRKQREHLAIFEKECMNEFLRQTEAAKRDDQGSRLRLVQERLDGLAKRLDEDRSRARQMDALALLRRPHTTALGVRLDETVTLAAGKFAAVAQPAKDRDQRPKTAQRFTPTGKAKVAFFNPDRT